MSDCLLSPKKGYYNLENTIGNKGDFITAPEISQIFGELIGLSFVDYWHQCKKPKSPIITDLGGGKGTMLDDCLRAISKVDKNLRKFIKANGPSLLEVKIKNGSLKKLSRPKNLLKIKENFSSILQTILKEKPSGVKGDFILSAFLTSTMGVSYKLKLDI